MSNNLWSLVELQSTDIKALLPLHAIHMSANEYYTLLTKETKVLHQVIAKRKNSELQLISETRQKWLYLFKHYIDSLKKFYEQTNEELSTINKKHLELLNHTKQLWIDTKKSALTHHKTTQKLEPYAFRYYQHLVLQHLAKNQKRLSDIDWLKYDETKRQSRDILEQQNFYSSLLEQYFYNINNKVLWTWPEN